MAFLPPLRPSFRTLGPSSPGGHKDPFGIPIFASLTLQRHLKRIDLWLAAICLLPEFRQAECTVAPRLSSLTLQHLWSAEFHFSPIQLDRRHEGLPFPRGVPC
jgi:hypothetical protein